MDNIHKQGLQGATFGAMDGIIIVMSMVSGLSVVGNKFILVISILTAGLADSFGNAAAFHVSEETELYHTKKEIWKATLLCFLATFLVTVVLAVPFWLFSLYNAIFISEGMGVGFLILLGYFVSRLTKAKNGCSWKLIVEYVLIGLIVAVISFLIGKSVSGLMQA